MDSSLLALGYGLAIERTFLEPGSTLKYSDFVVYRIELCPEILVRVDSAEPEDDKGPQTTLATTHSPIIDRMH